MAEGKNGFILYSDIIHTVEKLDDKKAGELFKHILKYVNDQYPETNDLIIELAFEPIKQSLKRDLKKYENICERNKLNGQKGGRPKNPKKPKEPIGLLGNPKKPKKPDSDSDSDSDNDIERDKEEKKEFDFSFFDNEFKSVWNDYLLMRLKIKKPATLKAELLALNKVKEFSGGNKSIAIEIVNNSILNSWQGIFNLKGSKRYRGKAILER